MARLGSRGSPMLKGGGVAFGPKPRDFSTKLPRKIYDLAWRTALSYRYRKGELVIIDGEMEFEDPSPRYAAELFATHGWGHEDGRSLLLTGVEKAARPNLYAAMEGAGEHGRVLTVQEVDVKDLLECGRVVVERAALEWILEEHQSDLVKTRRVAGLE